MKIYKVVLFALFTLFSSSAVAQNQTVYYGVVKGTLKNFNNLRQYCPSSGRSCIGSKYNQADHNVYQPLKDMRIQVRINGTLSGIGSTDALGNYQIEWVYPSIVTPSTIAIWATLEHKDGRFQVLSSNGGGLPLTGSTAVSLTSNLSNPQNLGTWHFGTANSPVSSAVTYEGAWRTWRYAFKYSNRLKNHFNNLEIYNGGSGASYFTGSPFRARIKASNKYEYSTIFHELAHAAAYKASKGQEFTSASQYCYPSTSGNCSHSFKTPEWGAPQFNEGLADFLGNVSATWSNGHDPYVCVGFGSSQCPNETSWSGSLDTETSVGASNCSTNDKRYQINTTKYLRDIYDQGDGHTVPYWKMIEVLYRFRDHSWENGKNEPWNSSLTAFDDLDGGRSTRDYQQILDAYIGTSSIAAYNWNCAPVGD